MLPTSSVRLIRIVGKRQANQVLPSCATSSCRSLHLPPLHRRWFLQGQSSKLLHDTGHLEASSFAGVVAADCDVTESDVYQYTDESHDDDTWPRRTQVQMSAGAHHYNNNYNNNNATSTYDEDYDEDHLHMTQSEANAGHVSFRDLGGEMLQHDDVLSVRESRHAWDSSHEYYGFRHIHNDESDNEGPENDYQEE